MSKSVKLVLTLVFVSGAYAQHLFSVDYSELSKKCKAAQSIS
jgi:hypothetical protein